MILAHQKTGNGPPLLVLHGLFGSARNWTTIARQLGERWAVYALDLRNHGESPWDDDMSYEAMAADVIAFMDDQGIASAPIIGHSMGGKAAMAAALTHQDRFEKLIVADIAPVAYRNELGAYVEAMQSVDLSAVSRRGEVDQLLKPSIPEQGIRAFLLQNLVSEDGGFRWRINLEALGRSMAVIGGFPDALLEAQFDGPALFIAGGQSHYIRTEHHATIHQLFPGAAIVEVPEAGHWVHAEAPKSFLQHAEGFLSG